MFLIKIISAQSWQNPKTYPPQKKTTQPSKNLGAINNTKFSDMVTKEVYDVIALKRKVKEIAT